MDTSDRVKRILGVLDKTLAGVQAEREKYHLRAEQEGRLHKWFSATLALVGVAAPAFVTYVTGEQGTGLRLAAILLTAIASATASLQTTFRWGDKYRRTSLTALALRELESTTQLSILELTDSIDELQVYKGAYTLNEAVERRLQKIIRKHIEGEVALVGPEPDATRVTAESKKLGS
jgi:hypothetical protein